MGNFSYVAVDNKTGKQIKGSMDADDIQLVYSNIKARGLTAVSVKEESALTKDIEIGFLQKKVSTRDLSVFCRQFVSIITAGVTIIDALEMLSEQTENKKLAAAIITTKESIQKGGTLAGALREQKEVFPEMMTDMVAAGEASGSLEVAFDRVATQLEKDAKLGGMMKKAMIYPCVVGIVAVGVVIVMLTFVIPNYVDMFAGMDMELPFLTRMVMAMSNFVIHYWYILIVVVVAAVVGINTFKKSIPGKEFFGKLAMKLPIISNMTVKSASSRFARTLSTLLYAGMPMMDALDIVADTMSNIWFERAIRTAREEVAKGVNLSVPIKDCGIFPPMVYHMIGIGEETGDIESMLEKLADYYDEEVELATQSMMAALEPMIIIILALIVGVLIGAVMSPMLAMYQGMDGL